MKINENIIARDLQGDLVLLNMENGDYFTLNPMGAEIYGHISRGKDEKQLVDILLEQYDVERKELESDVADLIEKLKQKKIII